MKKQVSLFCAVFVGIVCLSVNTFGQVLKVEPEKPKRGEKLKITYDPSAPGAAFTLEQPLRLSVEKFNLDGSTVTMKSIPMMRTGKVQTCEVIVGDDFVAVGLAIEHREKADDTAVSV